MVSLFNEVSGHIHSQIGVSLVVKYMYVVTSPNDRSGLGRNVGDPTSSVKYINSKSARLPGFNADDLCVVHIMSSAEFHQEAVGVAYIGTLCSPGTNAGISSDKNGKMSRSDYTSVMMHETGHTLGSSHDSFFSKGMLCAPPFHRYVMYPQVQSKSRNAHRFSPCSMDAIRAIISDPKKRCWDAKGIRQLANTPRGRGGSQQRPRQVVDYRRRVIVRTQQQQPQQRVVVQQPQQRVAVHQ
jgi:hypothetical protein